LVIGVKLVTTANYNQQSSCAQKLTTVQWLFHKFKKKRFKTIL